jgi:hypothetical protein
MTAISRVLLGGTLLLLPGVWLAFGLRLRELPGAARLALAGALSPVLVALEFCALRAVGLQFERAAWAVVVVNLPAIWLLVRARLSDKVSWRSLAGFLMAYLLLAGCVAFVLIGFRNTRVFTGHSWMQMGILYQFPNGRLWPEEPELAGIAVAYPWLGHAFWAVLAWTMALAPTKAYVVTNLACLLWLCVLIYVLSRHLGASAFASWVGLVWLGLGVNVVGSIVWSVAGRLGHGMWMPGDVRTTPWVRKFIVFEADAFALTLFSAALLVAVVALRSRNRSYLVLTAVLVTAIGLIYPLLFPPALLICGVLLAFLWWFERSQPGFGLRIRTLFAAIVAAGLVVLANAHLLAHSRVVPLLYLSPLISMLAKAATEWLALALFLLAIVFVRREQLFQPGVLLLLVTSVPILLLRPVLQVGAGHNEYKFLLTSALCLVPAATLAIDRWVTRRTAAVAIVGASVLLVVPALPALQTQQAVSNPESLPAVDESGFSIRLDPAEPRFGWIEAVRTLTPVETVVVARRADLFLPAVTERSLWSPPEHIQRVPGYWLDNRWNLVEERGYAAALFDAREQVVRCAYECQDERDLRKVESRLKSLGRPLAIVFAPGEGQFLLALLRHDKRAKTVYADSSGMAVWLVEQ